MTLVNAETGEVVAHTLEECEAVIERGLGTFVEVGEALMEIRDQRLYRSTHSDFDTYCRERWGFSRRRAGDFIEAADVASAVGEISPTTTPTRESHAAALAPLRDQPEAMAEVMAEVTEEAEATGSKVTAEKITEKVKERTTPPAPKRPPITKAAERAGWEIRKAAERIERLAADDRFAGHRTQMATQLRSHLTYALDVCTDVMEGLSQQSQED